MAKPRLLNTTQSAEYMGMKYDAFVEEVRPKLHPVKLTKRRKLFDVRELDALIESSKEQSEHEKDQDQCQQTNLLKPAYQVSIPEVVNTTCAKVTSVSRFRELLESKSDLGN